LSIPDLRKTPPCPDQIWLATNIFSSFDVSTDTSLSDKTVFAHPALPWERTILRKSGINTWSGNSHMPKLMLKLSPKYIRSKRKRLLKFKHHLAVVPITTLIVLIVLTAIGLVSLGGQTTDAADSHVVIVSYDKKKQTVPTRAADVGELLNRLNIALSEGDVVEPAVETPIVEDNFRINVYRARPVTVIDGDRKVFTLSAAATGRTIARRAGIVVYPEDDVRKELPGSILRHSSIGEEVVIRRATPAYLILYGTPVVVRTHAKTVGEVLKEKNVKLIASDTVQPDLATPLTPNAQIFVNRIGIQIATVEEPIPMPTKVIEDQTLSFGTTALRQQGTPGKRIVTYQIELRNGQEVGRVKIQEVIAQNPVENIIARGKAISIPADKTSLMAAAGIASSDYPYVNYIISRENALWCPTRWQGQTSCPAYYAEKFPGAESSTSVGYGVCQSTPANKMASAGADWRTSPVTQLRWCSGYATGRYGSWAAAYNFWIGHTYW